MTADIRDRVADSLLALMPLYHRHILKTGPANSGIRIAQYRVLGLLMKSGPHLHVRDRQEPLYLETLDDHPCRYPH